MRDDLISALLNLGFKKKQAEEGADHAIAAKGKDAGFDELIKYALQYLAGKPLPPEQKAKEQPKPEPVVTVPTPPVETPSPEEPKPLPRNKKKVEKTSIGSIEPIVSVLNKQYVLMGDMYDLLTKKNLTAFDTQQLEFQDESLETQKQILEVLSGNKAFRKEKQVEKEPIGRLGELGLLGTLGSIFAGLKNSLSTLFRGAGSIAKGLGIADLAFSIFESIKSIIKELFKSGDWEKAMYKGFHSLINTITLGLFGKDKLDKLYDKLTDFWDEGIHKFEDIFNSTFNITAKIDTFMSDILAKLFDTLSKITIGPIKLGESLPAPIKKTLGLPVIIGPYQLFKSLEGVSKAFQSEADETQKFIQGRNQDIETRRAIEQQYKNEERRSRATEALEPDDIDMFNRGVNNAWQAAVTGKPPIAGDQIAAQTEMNRVNASTMQTSTPIIISNNNSVNNSSAQMTVVKPFVRNQENTFSRFMQSRLGSGSVLDY